MNDGLDVLQISHALVDLVSRSECVSIPALAGRRRIRERRPARVLLLGRHQGARPRLQRLPAGPVPRQRGRILVSGSRARHRRGMGGADLGSDTCRAIELRRTLSERGAEARPRQSRHALGGLRRDPRASRRRDSLTAFRPVVSRRGVRIAKAHPGSSAPMPDGPQPARRWTRLHRNCSSLSGQDRIAAHVEPVQRLRRHVTGLTVRPVVGGCRPLGSGDGAIGTSDPVRPRPSP